MPLRRGFSGLRCVSGSRAGQREGGVYGDEVALNEWGQMKSDE